MRIEFPATPGKPFSGALTLSNSASEKVRVRVELLDFYLDASMTPQFVPNAPTEGALSCRNWLSVNPMEVELQPQSQMSARFTVRVPADARESSFHCAVGFVSLPAATESTASTGMLTAVRMVATLYPIVGRPAVKGEIRDLKLEQLQGEGVASSRAVVVMDNQGQMLYRPAGEVSVVDGEGKVVESMSLASFPTLPQRQQRYLLPIKTDLRPGVYTLKARIEIGDEVQEASATVTVGPEKVASVGERAN